MKNTTTYPTRHPHWIDEDDYSTPRRKGSGISFSAAFAIVLALHLAGIAGIYAYSHWKPKKSSVAFAKEKPPGPKSDALEKNTWPQPEAKPEVVALPPKPTLKNAVKTDSNPAASSSPKAVAKAKETTKKSEAPKRAAKKTGREQDGDLLRQFLESVGKLDKAGETVAAQAVGSVDRVARQLEPIEIAVPATAASDAEFPARKAEAPIAASQDAPRVAATQYTLAPGDNLYMVSRKLGVSYNDLARANGIQDPRTLRVGQTLKVPPSL